MCMEFHNESFLGQVVEKIKKIIKYDPKKVGEITFSNLPPWISHLGENSTKKMSATINNAVGSTLMFLKLRYANETDDSLDNIFDEEITPFLYAKFIIDMSKMALSRIKIKGLKIKKPTNEDFGNKRIYFFLLKTILEMSIDHLASNQLSIMKFKSAEKSWKDFVRLASEDIQKMGKA